MMEHKKNCEEKKSIVFQCVLQGLQAGIKSNKIIEAGSLNGAKQKSPNTE